MQLALGILVASAFAAGNVPPDHFRTGWQTKTTRGNDVFSVLCGPLAGSSNIPREAEVRPHNAGVELMLDRGYVFLASDAEEPSDTAHTDNMNILRPLYQKALRSTAIRIATPGSRLVLQVLDNWEGVPVGSAGQRVYLRDEDGTHTAVVHRIGPDGRPVGDPINLIEDGTADEDEGQYAELVRNNGGWELRGPFNIHPLPADSEVRRFLDYADRNARQAGLIK